MPLGLRQRPEAPAQEEFNHGSTLIDTDVHGTLDAMTTSTWAAEGFIRVLPRTRDAFIRGKDLELSRPQDAPDPMT